MSTDTAPATNASAPKTLRLPPEEQFWKRYSPHSELPLSAIGSFALHFLSIGLLILLVWLGWLGFRKTSGAVPVEVVRLGQTGGGGGKPNGVGPGKGIGSGIDAVESDTKTDDPQTPSDPDQDRAKLDPNAVALAPELVQKDDAFKRLVKDGNPNLNIFGINQKTLSKLRDGLQPGQGRGGTGEGGGRGNGQGTGDGDGKGPGSSGALTNREKRMLRWTMIFNTRSGNDYLTQLRGLGAVLAVPTGPDNKSYKVIRDLSGQRQPQLLDEDVSKIQCIFWIDDRPDSVRSLAGALRLGSVPNHIVAFMPRELEDKLYEMEKRAAGVPEEQIQETRFDVIRAGGRYEPRVVSVTPRR